MSESTEKARRSPGSALWGVASMAASLGAVVFLLTSDVAVAEGQAERAEAGKEVAAVQPKLREHPASAEQMEQLQAPAKAAKKGKASKKKRIDLGRFEGY